MNDVAAKKKDKKSAGKIAEEKMLEKVAATDRKDREASIARLEEEEEERTAGRAQTIAAVELRSVAISKKYGPHITKRIQAGFFQDDQLKQILEMPVDGK